MRSYNGFKTLRGRHVSHTSLIPLDPNRILIHFTFFTATLCLFSTGMCFSWSSPSLAILQDPESPIQISNDQASWIASLMPFGSALGPILGSMSAKYLGPKQTIMISSIPFLIGNILIVFATSAPYFYASRFISGIGVGFGFTAVPIYIGEVAEDSNRGALMILLTLMMGFGGTLMTCIGPYISLQSMATISCVIPILMLAALACVPDSPYFLMKISKEDESRKALKWFRRQKEDEAVSGELNLIRKSVESNVRFMDSLKEIKIQPNPKALMVVFSAVVAQQLCGAVTISYYQEQFYASSDIPLSPEKAVIMTQFISAIFGIGTIFIVDRWGRKPLLITSSLGCAASNLLIAIYFTMSYIEDPFFKWLPVVASNLLLIFFAIGLAPIPYMILGEIFSSNFKELAICIVSVGGAITSSITTKLFQVFSDSLGKAFVFYLLAVVTLLFAIVNLIIVPETMGKSLLESQQLLMKKPKSEMNKPETYQITCKV
jgi:MFS family permease